MNPKMQLTDCIYKLFDEYYSLVQSKGVRRAKAVEWASHKMKNVKDALVDFKSEEVLLQKIGWNTFIGFGLYSGLMNLFKDDKRKEFIELHQTLKTLLNDIILYTSIGHVIAFGVSIEDTDKIRFARMDNTGNVFIFCADADELINYIEEINNEW